MPDSTFPYLNKQQLQRDIEQRLTNQPIKLLYLDCCESTNIECLKLGEHRTVIIAERQSAGRGRRGRKWHSPLSQNIYCSIGLNKSLPAEILGLVSLQVGVCIAQVLRDKGYSGISLKWPNDILIENKKLGGILIETRAVGQDEFYLVIGFGLNVNLHTAELPRIDQPAISLHQTSAVPVDRHDLLSQLVSSIVDAVNHFEQFSIQNLLEEFNHFDRYQGKQVLVKTVHESFTGLYQGIEKTGQIKIKTKQGLQIFSAAEISLREARDQSMLLIDCGNSALKCRWIGIEKTHDQVFSLQRNSGLSEFNACLQLMDAQQVVLASVASDKITTYIIDSIGQKCPKARFSQLFTVPELNGVINGYHDFRLLGVDRWLTLIAASAQLQTDTIIIDAGSAITIDLLSHKTGHLGGAILPGFQTGLTRFRQLFPTVDFDHPDIENVDLPGRSTAHCINISEIPASVEQVQQIMNNWLTLLEQPVQILLSGQDACLISDQLTQPHQVIPDLVFTGMLKQIQLLE